MYSPEERHQPLPGPVIGYQILPVPGERHQPVSSPGNGYQLLPDPGERHQPVPGPRNGYQPVPQRPTSGERHQPVSGPGNGYQPVPQRPTRAGLHLHLHLARPKLDYYDMLNLTVDPKDVTWRPSKETDASDELRQRTFEGDWYDKQDELRQRTFEGDWYEKPRISRFPSVQKLDAEQKLKRRIHSAFITKRGDKYIQNPVFLSIVDLTKIHAPEVTEYGLTRSRTHFKIC